MEAIEAHTVKEITNNLYSINKMVMTGYIPIFKKNNYQSTTVEI